MLSCFASLIVVFIINQIVRLRTCLFLRPWYPLLSIKFVLQVIRRKSIGCCVEFPLLPPYLVNILHDVAWTRYIMVFSDKMFYSFHFSNTFLHYFTSLGIRGTTTMSFIFFGEWGWERIWKWVLRSKKEMLSYNLWIC